MSIPTLTRESLPPMLSLKQYADYTGCSYDTVKDLARQNRLPAPVERLGKRYLIPRDALLNQLDGTTGIERELAGLRQEVAALRRILSNLFIGVAQEAQDDHRAA
jgi:excisionase family DNA binding protein